MKQGAWIPEDFYDTISHAIKGRDPEMLSRVCAWAGVKTYQTVCMNIKTMEHVRQTYIFGPWGTFAVGWELASEQRQ